MLVVFVWAQNCQPVDFDEENSNLMSVSSESLILDRFRFRDRRRRRQTAVGGMPAKPVIFLRIYMFWGANADTSKNR